MSTPIEQSSTNLFSSATRDYHSPWSSTVDMMQSVMSLMQQSRWVRNYLLDNGLQRVQDASILASTKHTKFAYTQSCRQDDDNGSYWTQMFVPAYSNGSNGAGVIARYSSGMEFSFINGLHRFVAVFAIAVIFLSGVTTKINYPCLRFTRAAFLHANGGDGEVDFFLLHRHLVDSISGRYPGESITTKMTNTCYPFPMPHISGERLLRQFRVCAYSNTVPLMRFKADEIDSWKFHQIASEIQRLKQMGIASILRRTPHRIPILIAPAPEEPKSNGVEIDKDMARTEKRKIKKRESAAKCYSRKREKRIAALRVQGESGNGKMIHSYI